eukprot:SAG11_NODE_4298_length_1965_cov_1.415863_4_plen_39_part_01
MTTWQVSQMLDDMESGEPVSLNVGYGAESMLREEDAQAR